MLAFVWVCECPGADWLSDRSCRHGESVGGARGRAFYSPLIHCIPLAAWSPWNNPTPHTAGRWPADWLLCQPPAPFHFKTIGVTRSPPSSTLSSSQGQTAPQHTQTACVGDWDSRPYTNQFEVIYVCVDAPQTVRFSQSFPNCESLESKTTNSSNKQTVSLYLFDTLVLHP